MFVRTLAAAVALSVAGCATVPPPLPDAAASQRAWAAACAGKDGWDEPGPPFRVHGNTFYVGTCGITSLLVTGPGGHTLIDSGTDRGAEVVLANIRTLGFDPREVTAILISHEHFDHVGGMARIQAATGATIYASTPAAAVLRSGRTAPDDPQARSGHPPFPPVTGRIVELTGERTLDVNGAAFRPIMTPGHTLGATSWSWRACEEPVCRSIVYADSLNPISSDGYRFSDHPALLAAFRTGIAKLAGAECDIVIAPHPGAVALKRRALGEAPLADPAACRAFAAGVAERLERRLAQERAGG